jgi:small-conductance mechanosensitive channel
VPFGLGIVFFPLLLISLWRALRTWPWGVTVGIIVPFLVFSVCWGGASTGMLREGLHAWVLTLLVVVALEQQSERFAWWRKPWLRGLLSLRAVEVLLVAMLPTFVTTGRLYQDQFRWTDFVAVAAMVVLTGYLGIQVWRERAEVRRTTTAQSPSSRDDARPVGIGIRDG